MNFATVCSGIEAASQAWAPLGWQPVFFSEIEPFPCAYLAHHYPDVPNLGDMTQWKDWPDATLDVLAGGTPCQSFSVAGLRAGLADPRGNLTLTFLRLVEKYKPAYVVWENVPGIISAADDPLGQFMAGLNELGYAIDCDILDAQHFGLAQRRRRVFFVCHSIDIGRQKRTPLFANATGQFLSEMLLSVLAEASDPSRLGADTSEWPARLTRRGLLPKMKCFGVPSSALGSADGLTTWLKNLLTDWEEALRRFAHGSPPLGSRCDLDAGSERAGTPGARSSASGVPRLCSNTVTSWRNISGVLCDLMSMSITSTATRTTTTSEIYTCAQVSLSIVQSIIKSTASPENYFDGDGSGLTALRAFTNYARQAASDLFGNIDGLCDWNGFISEAEGAIRELERGLGDRAHTGTLFSDAEGLRWYSPPRRETGQGIAVSPTLRAGGNRTGGDRPPGTDVDTCETLIPVANSGDAGYCLTASAQQSLDAETETLIAVAHSLRAEGFDASEDGTGRQNLVPVAFGAQNSAAQGDGVSVNYSPTLDKSKTPAVAFDLAQITSAANRTRVSSELPASTLNAAGQMHVAQTLAVRRLTPIECERLMGFPDNATRIPYRGKPADQCPDGPRYKALGNSWAVNCAEWIGERIELVEGMMQAAAVQWGGWAEEQERARG